MYTRFANEVRAIDTSARMLSAGGGYSSSNGYNAAYNETGDNDNESQYKTIFKDQNPSPIDTLGGHFYRNDQNRTTWIPTVTYNTEQKRFDKFLQVTTAAATEVGKPSIIGEFGCGQRYDDSTFDPAEARNVFERMVSSIMSTNTSLALIWNFGSRGDSEWDVSPAILPIRTYQMDIMKAKNELLGIGN
jgi:hypothetical protein